MKALLNSNLLPIISVGMYCSRLDPEHMFDSYFIDQDKEEGYIEFSSEEFWSNFDNNAYVSAIERLAKSHIDGEYQHEGITVKIKAGALYSPKYYNYETDQIDLAVNFPKVKLAKFIEKNRVEFDAFIKKHYSSYDGFMSFTANSYDGWKLEYDANRNQELAAALHFWFSKVDDDRLSEYAFYEYVSENVYSSNFYKEPEATDA